MTESKHEGVRERARLNEAAPDLLAACIEAQIALSKLNTVGGGAQAETAKAMLYNAIAKAEGSNE